MVSSSGPLKCPLCSCCPSLVLFLSSWCLQLFCWFPGCAGHPSFSWSLLLSSSCPPCVLLLSSWFTSLVFLVSFCPSGVLFLSSLRLFLSSSSWHWFCSFPPVVLFLCFFCVCSLGGCQPVSGPCPPVFLFFPKQVTVRGSQCFLRVSALLRDSMSAFRLRACLPSSWSLCPSWQPTCQDQLSSKPPGLRGTARFGGRAHRLSPGLRDQARNFGPSSAQVSASRRPTCVGVASTRRQPVYQGAPWLQGRASIPWRLDWWNFSIRRASNRAFHWDIHLRQSQHPETKRVNGQLGLEASISARQRGE